MVGGRVERVGPFILISVSGSRQSVLVSLISSVSSQVLWFLSQSQWGASRLRLGNGVNAVLSVGDTNG